MKNMILMERLETRESKGHWELCVELCLGIGAEYGVEIDTEIIHWEDY